MPSLCPRAVCLSCCKIQITNIVRWSGSSISSVFTDLRVICECGGIAVVVTCAAMHEKQISFIKYVNVWE